MTVHFFCSKKVSYFLSLHPLWPPQTAPGRQVRCQCHHQRAPSSLRQTDRQLDKRMQQHHDKATQTHWRSPSHAVSPNRNNSRDSTPDRCTFWFTETFIWCLKQLQTTEREFHPEIFFSICSSTDCLHDADPAFVMWGMLLSHSAGSHLPAAPLRLAMSALWWQHQRPLQGIQFIRLSVVLSLQQF